MKSFIMKGFIAGLVAALTVAVNAEWRLHESIDLMDDSKFMLALSQRVESSTPADHDPEATLRVGCYPELDNRNYGRIVRPTLWTTYLNLDDHRGRVRFGDEPPMTMGAWADRGDDIARLGLLIDGPDAWGFISRLLTSDKVLVELPQYGSNPVFLFPVGDKGREVIRQVFNTCNVNEATGRTVWWREGTVTLLAEQRVRRPKYGGHERNIVPSGYHPPLINTRTGLVVIPSDEGSGRSGYVHGDNVVAVEIGGEEVDFVSSEPWNFTVPVLSALSGNVEITYIARTSDQVIINLYGQYERQYRLSFRETGTR